MIRRKIKIVFWGVLSFFLFFSYLEVHADNVQRGTGEVIVEYTPDKEEQKNEYKGHKVLKKHTSNLPQTGEQNNLLGVTAFCVGIMFIIIFFKEQRKNGEK